MRGQMSRERVQSEKSVDEKRERKPLSGEGLRSAWRFYGYLLRYKWIFFPSLVALFATASLSLAFPFLMGTLIGQGAAEADLPEWLQPLFAGRDRVILTLFGVLAVQAFVAYWRIIGFVTAGERALADARHDLFRHLVTLPVNFFNEHRAGELSNRVSADLGMIREMLLTTIPQLVRHLVILVGGAAAIFILSTKLAVFTLAVLPVVILAVATFGRRIRKLSKQAQDELANANVVIEEAVQGIQSVKSFANEVFEIERHKRSLDGFVASTLTAGRARAFFVSFIIFVLFGAIATVAWFGVRMVEGGDLSQAAFAQFIFFAIFVGASLGSLPDVFGQLSKGVGATERLRELLDEAPEKMNIDEPVRLVGRIDVKGVSFAYPSRPDNEVLSDVSFTVCPGQKIAFVGASGGGKSTLFQLLQGFYPLPAGSIQFDARNLDELPYKGLREQMAIVPQDVVLFGGSIFENILYGKPAADRESVIAAAKQANAHEFIMSFPEGYETLVGPRGVKVSGGQRQRLAVARAILADPKILLLDEATSALDSESEKAVQEALERLMKGRTTLIIAHRLATVRNCDCIHVLQDGKIVESGNHEQLMASSDGFYRLLVRTQML